MLQRWKHALTGLVLILSSILVTLGGSEFAFRGYQWWRWATPMLAPVIRPSPSFPVVLDDRLGWRAAENYSARTMQKNVDGSPYSRTLSQNEYGFRTFGELDTRRKKLFVIGDSFTHALEVSDDKTYYAVLKNVLNAEVFAYGVIGYGTVQEYLVFDDYVDLIKPDLILWQLCSNDFVNNSPELEERSSWENSGAVRPYFVDGQISYVLAKRWAFLRKFAQRHSRLLHVVLGRVDGLLGTSESVELEIERLGATHDGFARAIQATDLLMERISKRAAQIPVVAFSADDKQPYFDALKTLFSRQGIRFLGSVRPALREAERAGAVVLAADGNHWNETGHRIVGETLASALQSEIVSPQSKTTIQQQTPP